VTARSARIAVGVSGGGSNLRAIVAAADRAELGGEVVLVFADRHCAALDWAAERRIATAIVPVADPADAPGKAAEDAALAGLLAEARADLVVLAGYMRIVGPAVLGAYPGRILNTHPSLLPAFPGGHAVRDALAHGAAVSGATVHLVDATLDGGPIVAQEAVPILADDDEASLHARIRSVEHRLLPRAVALAIAGALNVAPGSRRVSIDVAGAEAALTVPRRAQSAIACATRRGNGHTPACARKTLSRATGNSRRRNASLASSSVNGMR